MDVINLEKIKLNNIMQNSELNRKLVVELTNYKNNSEISDLFKTNDELFEKIKNFIVIKNNCENPIYKHNIYNLIQFILVLNDFTTENIEEYIKNSEYEKKSDVKLKYLNDFFLHSGGILEVEKMKDIIDVIGYFKQISEKVKTLTLKNIKPKPTITTQLFGSSLKNNIINYLNKNNYIFLNINSKFFYDTDIEKEYIQKTEDIEKDNDHAVVITNYKNGFITIKNSWGTSPHIMFIGKKIVDIDFFLNNSFVKKAEFFVFEYTINNKGGTTKKKKKTTTKKKKKTTNKKKTTTKRKKTNKKKTKTNKKYK